MKVQKMFELIFIILFGIFNLFALFFAYFLLLKKQTLLMIKKGSTLLMK